MTLQEEIFNLILSKPENTYFSTFVIQKEFTPKTGAEVLNILEDMVKDKLLKKDKTGRYAIL